MRCREQSQNSMSMARSCLDSSLSLFRHSMKSLRPPCGPSSQMKAHSLGRRSSRCVRPTTREKQPELLSHDELLCIERSGGKKTQNGSTVRLTREYLESYLRERRQSRLVEHADAAHLLNFGRVHPLPSHWFEDVPHGGRLLKSALEEV